MTAATSFGVLSPFAVKQEKNVDSDDDDDDNVDSNYDDAISVSSLAQPSILAKDCFDQCFDPSDEFLRLTSMVRRVYFSYLHKSVISNYNICCQPKEKDVPKSELKKFSSQMELYAVRASLEASLYRQAMLKMISDIKSNTSRNKVHKELRMFLETPPSKVDVGVQTSEDYPCKQQASESSYAANGVHIQSTFVTSNFDENLLSDSKNDQKDLDKRISELLKVEKQLSAEPETIEEKSRVRTTQKSNKIRVKVDRIKKSDDKKRKTGQIIDETLPLKVEEPVAPEIQQVDNQIDNDMQDIFGDNDVKPDPLRNDDQESQDSLMQHLEDMFCESDDSSDLMTLIEKHSGVSKANLDSEIGKMCEVEPPPLRPIKQPQSCRNLKQDLEKPTENTADKSTTKRKLSFSNYKKMKKRAMGEPETPEERQNRKAGAIWFVERVHQAAKLKTKMMELSITNYRKHGRLRKKFIELFGEEDEEEMMPDSPVHIEEHLSACKERLAPWVVKHLMPFYSKRVIKDRLLFKTVAKHIADMLIIKNTFPEEDDVAAYIKDYFRNKTSIKSESDIYI